LFAGDGVHGIADQKSREPKSLTRSLAMTLRTVKHGKIFGGASALLIVTPEHMRVFREAGWSKARFREELDKCLSSDGSELIRGASGIAEGMPASSAGRRLTKFGPDGLLIVHTGGSAGMWSAVIGGWAATGSKGSSPVTVAIKS